MTNDSVLDYLERLPGYPFDPDVDPDFRPPDMPRPSLLLTRG